MGPKFTEQAECLEISFDPLQSLTPLRRHLFVTPLVLTILASEHRDRSGAQFYVPPLRPLRPHPFLSIAPLIRLPRRFYNRCCCLLELLPSWQERWRRDFWPRQLGRPQDKAPSSACAVATVPGGGGSRGWLSRSVIGDRALWMVTASFASVLWSCRRRERGAWQWRRSRPAALVPFSAEAAAVALWGTAKWFAVADASLHLDVKRWRSKGQRL